MLHAAVLYARVSSKDQEREGFSIPAQLDLLRSYAARHSLKLAQEFVDVETAKAAGRLQFSAPAMTTRPFTAWRSSRAFSTRTPFTRWR